MSERGKYPAGVPCWVETLQPDPRTAMDFYGPLFGWEFARPAPMPGDSGGQYFVARLRDRDVAGIGSMPDRNSAPKVAWTTYVRVDGADESAERARGAGGSLRDGPFDASPAGRAAVLVDPSGAPVGVWEAGTREGAGVVNEPGAWSMSMLYTTDPWGAKAFYGAVFGWQLDPPDLTAAQLGLWRLPGYVGGEPLQPVPRDVVGVLVPIGGDELGAVESTWSVDFWVADADAAAERAARLGGRVIVPPYDTPGFRNVELADPQGASFSISQLVSGP
ncbi:MAG: VOC family protein [Actinomycetota bacterium]